jgi:hypothetical protein
VAHEYLKCWALNGAQKRSPKAGNQIKIIFLKVNVLIWAEDFLMSALLTAHVQNSKSVHTGAKEEFLQRTHSEVRLHIRTVAGLWVPAPLPACKTNFRLA